jgi:hypothetical protein
LFGGYWQKRLQSFVHDGPSANVALLAEWPLTSTAVDFVIQLVAGYAAFGGLFSIRDRGLIVCVSGAQV